jgi:hypothetical protein
VGASGRFLFIWTEATGMQSLQDLLVNTYGLNLAGWSLLDPVAVSDDGHTIVGVGVHTSFGLEAWIAHLADPCPGDLNGDGQVDLADLGILLADFGCTAPGPCPGDIDGDGDTDLADLGILLANFGEVCP